MKDIRGAAEDYADKMAEHGLHWIPTGPTREAANTETIIDHIFVRELRMETTVRTRAIGGITDHRMLLMTLKMNTTLPRPCGSHTKVDWIRFTAEISNIDRGAYYTEKDPDTLIDKLLSDLELSRMASTKSIEKLSRDVPVKPWITRNILKLRNARDKL